MGTQLMLECPRNNFRSTAGQSFPVCCRWHRNYADLVHDAAAQGHRRCALPSVLLHSRCCQQRVAMSWPTVSRAIHHASRWGRRGAGVRFWPLFRSPPPLTSIVVAPKGLMEAVADMGGHWPSGAIHFEFWRWRDGSAGKHGFDVRLRSSGQVIHVATQCSILDALRAPASALRSSCERYLWSLQDGADRR